MSMRRYRNGPPFQSTPRDTPDSFYSLGRVFGTRQGSERAVRNMDRGSVQKMRVETNIESSKKPSCSSLSSDYLKQHIRRSYINRHRLPGLPVRDWSPLHSYLPGAAVGYRRLWMQDNPWPDHSSKETGTRRDGGQNHPYRLKYREQRRQSQELNFVPGGSLSDPLNLAGCLSEDLPVFLQSPVRGPERYDMPANNFIAINERDPLGLTQDEDDLMPLALKYPLGPYRKRKRSRCKKREQGNDSGSQLHAKSADIINTSADMESHQAKNMDSGDHSVPSEDSAVLHFGKVEDEAGDAKRTGSLGQDSVSEKPAADTVGSSDTFSGSADNNSAADSSEGSQSQALVLAEACSGISGAESIPPAVSSGDVPEPAGQIGGQTHGSDGVSDQHQDVSDLHELKKQGPSAPFRKRSSSLPQGKNAEAGRKLKHDLGQTLYKELQKKYSDMKQQYPHPLEPIESGDRGKVPLHRKPLKKALKIDPSEPEQQERVHRERAKKEREFKRARRYPNLKSPEEEDDGQQSAEKQGPVETLKGDVDLSSEKNKKEPVSVHEPQSRTLDSIISPVLRPDSGQIRKRRRTVSDCNTESAEGASKKLVFRRSSSPDVRSSHHSPRKIRRLSSGSGQEEEKTATEQKQQIKFSKNPAYKHGNYYRYYGYRTPAMAPDFRLYFFRKQWFEGKDVLDIGCNAGDVTLAVAQLFHPRKIVGMDIDPNLIRIARQNIRSHQTKANMYQMEKFPVSTTEYGPIEPLPALTNPCNIFPKNVMFMQGNYVLKSDKELDHVKGEYDTILALSITKWIHLNHGDKGLKRVFHRMFQQLRPGGRLVLEPQTWASYRRRKKLSATIYDNYNSIQLKPNDFANYLTETVGFCRREFLGQPFNPSKGFQRPLWLFTKYKSSPDNTPKREVEEPRPIGVRIAHLAGYQATPDFHGTPGPYSSSPVVQFQNYPDNLYHPPSVPFPAPPSGFQQPYPNPYRRDPYEHYNPCDPYPYEGYYEENMEDGQQEREQESMDTSSQRVGGESVSSSTDNSASSSVLIESCASTSSSQHQEQPQSSSSPEVSQEWGMEWLGEGEQLNGHQAEQVEMAAEQYEEEEEEDPGDYHGHVNGDLLLEDPDLLGQNSPELPVGEEHHSGQPPAGNGELGVAGELAMPAGHFEEPAAEVELLQPAQASCSPEMASPTESHDVDPEEDCDASVPPVGTSSLSSHEVDPTAGGSEPSSSFGLSWQECHGNPASMVSAGSGDADSEGQSVTVSHRLVQHPEVSSSREGQRTACRPPSSSGAQELADPSSHQDSSLSQDSAGSSHSTLPESSDLPPETHAGRQPSLSAEDVADQLPQTSTQAAGPSSEDVLSTPAESSAEVAAAQSDTASGEVGGSCEADSSQCPDSEDQ